MKKSLEEIEGIFRSNDAFGSVDKGDIVDLIKLGDLKTWLKGSQVISKGETGEALYVILTGKAKVTLYGEGGKEIVLSVIDGGDFFGEMSLFDGEPRSANVEAMENMECLVLKRRDFLSYLKEHPAVAVQLLIYQTKRLREADRKIGGLALLDVCGRIANTFIGLAEKEGKGDDVTRIRRITHEDIAAMIGSSREVVSRALKKMSEEGYIGVEKDSFVLYLGEFTEQ
ncbi:MAG: Crp/Fnr family transcriptional regulator [Thermodesulfobacteriota bacterium]